MRIKRKHIKGIIGVRDGLKDGFRSYIGYGHRRGKDRSGF
jgi:hypothetical protein